MTTLMLLLCIASISTAWAQSSNTAYSTPQFNKALSDQLAIVAEDLNSTTAGQTEATIRKYFLSAASLAITQHVNAGFIAEGLTGPLYKVIFNTDTVNLNDIDCNLAGPYIDVTHSLSFTCNPALKSSKGLCIYRHSPFYATVTFDGANWKALVFAAGVFNKCNQPSGPDTWIATFDNTSAKANQTSCYSAPPPAASTDCGDFTNSCYVKWPCLEYCTCNITCQ